MKMIPLSDGTFAKVDDWHFERIAQFGTWYYCESHEGRGGSVCCHIRIEHNKHVTIRMHHLILPPQQDKGTDHVNGDCRDNQEHNLRYATKSQNGANRPVNKNSTSGFKGVCFVQSKYKWKAQIMVNRKNHHLGYFATPVEAARAYDEAAKKYFGEFARTNLEENGHKQEVWVGPIVREKKNHVLDVYFKDSVLDLYT